MTGDFKLIFIGILIETIPFIALASFVAFLVGVFISEERLKAFFSARPVTGIFMAAALGIFVPVCECGIIPLVRKLMDRGVPAPAALTFMIASPSMNPIVMASTGIAFASMPHLIYWRFALALPLVLICGLIFLAMERRGGKLETVDMHAHEHCDTCCHVLPSGAGYAERARIALDEAVEDFLHMLGYIIVAALLTAAVQVLLPREWLQSLGSHAILALPAMMLFAFITSTCSDSDAFIAAAMTQFSPASRLGYLLLGPVVDFKLVMLQAAFLPKRARNFLWLGYPVLVILAVAAFSIINYFTG